MARNKYPEQTIERILNVATKLFFEKGYENTSIQDILNELKDLSKGAIYHHFKSKEAIFDAIALKIGQSNAKAFTQFKNDKNLTGAEKLKKMISFNIYSEDTKKIIKASPSLLDNPKFLAIQLKEIQNVVTPNFVFPIVEEGIRDKSINTDKPYELAEVIVILLNIWINPIILGTDINRTCKKCELINELLERYNINLFDNDMIEELSKY